MTVLGIDFGLQRTGMAFSAEGTTMAFPGPVFTGDEDEVIRQIEREAASRGATEIVVGLPRHMDGTESPMSTQARDFADKLAKAVSAKVVMWDERLTSRQADRAMLSGDLSRRKRKQRIDSLAAQLILQSYLDAQARKA
jgi:putative holliday junction resolvase